MSVCSTLLGSFSDTSLGPQTFRPKDAPRYIPAIATILVCYSLCFCDIVFIWWYCKRQNSKKAAVRAAPGYMKLENSEYVSVFGA